MDAMLRPIRMDTTLPGLMSMPILDPMSMPIHLGIMSPIITPIEHSVLSTGVACDIRTQELEKGGRVTPAGRLAAERALSEARVELERAKPAAH